jgi:hypothetical protein
MRLQPRLVSLWDRTHPSTHPMGEWPVACCSALFRTAGWQDLRRLTAQVQSLLLAWVCLRWANRGLACGRPGLGAGDMVESAKAAGASLAQEAAAKAAATMADAGQAAKQKTGVSHLSCPVNVSWGVHQAASC